MTSTHISRALLTDDEPASSPARKPRGRQSSPRKERVLVAQRRQELMERESRRELAEFFIGAHQAPPLIRHPSSASAQQR